jgi:hypothetical protein
MSRGPSVAGPEPAPGPGPGGLAPIAGGSPELDIESDWPTSSSSVPSPEVVVVAVLFAGLSIFFGIVPSPLFHLAAHAGNALSGIF